PLGLRPSSGSGDARHRARERKRAFARAVRRGLLGALVLAATAAVVLALRPRPVPIDAMRVVRGPLVSAVEESGVTRVQDRYLVSAPVSGNLSRLVLEPGDPVQEGDVLAAVAPAQSPLLDGRARAEAEGRLGASLSALEQARAQASRAAVARELADQDLSRARALVASGSAPRQSLDQDEFEALMRAQEVASAEFATKVATEEVRIARAALATGDGARAVRHVDVLAPVSGRILRVNQKSAGIVQAGTLLVEVGDPSALEIVVDLLTTDAVHVTPGTPATIEGWGGDAPLSGRVRRVEPSAFTRPSALGVDEQRVNVVIALTDPRERWSALADGYRVEARLVMWRGDDVLQVPQGDGSVTATGGPPSASMEAWRT
ncbi:MAG TPA: HlyD family efflux transporter periplasmic adaptor subunit, partial [Polyangiaceae bacterium]